MSFTPKNWIDTPSTATPLSAVAIEDLETRVTDYTDSRFAEGSINVKSHGATGDGSTDDTSAIDDAVAAITQLGATDPSHADYIDGPPLYFPFGQYVYNGSVLFDCDAIGANNIAIVGDGPGVSEVMLDSGAYLVDNSTQTICNVLIENLRVENGEGVFRSTNAGVNVLYNAVVRNCVFRGYTKAAFSIESVNWPFWYFENCMFWGDNASGDRFGVAMVDAAAAAAFVRCHFQSNKYDIKCGKGGAGLRIRDCDFIPDDYPSGGGRIPVWIVPDPNADTGGVGLTIESGTKFGNEGKVSGDRMIVFADEGAGSTVADRLPVLGADSTGYCMGAHIEGTFFVNAGWGAGQTEILYSTTPNLHATQVGGRVYGELDYAVRLRTPAPLPVGTVIGPVMSLSPTFPATNATTGAALIDPQQQLTVPDIASAATLTLPAGFNERVVQVTGSTTITDITPTGNNGTFDGAKVTLYFTSTAQVTDGGNLGLAGNFTGGAGRTLTLACIDGAYWFEIARSAN